MFRHYSVNRLTLLLCLVFVSALCLNAFAEEKMDSHRTMTKEEKMKQDSMMAVWMKYSTPGAEHNMLNKTAGKWKTHTKLWMSENGEPQVSDGMSERDVIIGGRFLREKYSGNMSGMPFEGEGILGYDNFRGEYTFFWIDNLGTSMSLASGKYDADKKEIVYQGKVDEPAINVKDQNVQYITRFIDDDHFVFEMYDTIKGKIIKVGEIMHERIK